MNFIAEDPSILVEWILGGLFVIEGVIQILTGKTISQRNLPRKYTQ